MNIFNFLLTDTQNIIFIIIFNLKISILMTLLSYCIFLILSFRWIEKQEITQKCIFLNELDIKYR